jgi:hypothetical protein
MGVPMSRRSRRPGFLAAASLPAAVTVALVACDQVYADPVTRAAGVVRTDAGLTTPKSPTFACVQRPAENSPCTRLGAICELGSSPDPECNRRYVCEGDPTYGSYWTEQRPPRCIAACPESAAIVDGAPCALDVDGGDAAEAELQCTIPLGTCACTTGPDGQHAHPRRWVCRQAGPDCPDKRPNLGQPCLGAHSCDYGACDFKRGARMVCAGDVWQIDAVVCP